MKMIGIADLKSRLSEYLAQVRSGEEIVVTDRGVPVARIVAVDTGHADIDQLVREGLATPGAGPVPDDFFSHPRPAATGAAVSEALIEERRSGR